MIVAIDPATAADEVLRQMYRLRAGIMAEASANAPFDAEVDVIAQWRHPPATHRVQHWIDGDPVHAHAELLVTPGNPAANIRLLVAPDHRRRGLGSALLVLAAGQARAAGCTVLGTATGLAAGEAFARAAGATLGHTYVRSVLRLPPAPDPVPLPDGYAFRSWLGPVPEELLVGYANARNAINDAPMDDGIAGDVWTPEAVREAEASLAARGRQLRVTVAVDRSDVVAGFTELRVSPEFGAIASTEDTAVGREHRGKGVARAIKAESLRMLAADRPDVRQVTTVNAAHNAAMLAVNRALGFEPTARIRGVTLTL